MKVKLTPLNIVSAICLVIAALLVFNKMQMQGAAYPDVNYLLAGLSFLAAVIAFISDLIFRKFIPDLKKLWAVECVLAIFILILIFIIKASIT